MEEKYQQSKQLSIEHRINQINRIADAIKTYISMKRATHCTPALISMNVKSMIFPPDLKESIIGSSTLALAEIFTCIWNEFLISLKIQRMWLAIGKFSFMCHRQLNGEGGVMMKN